MKDNRKVVWLIEDDAEQADQYGRLLENASEGRLRVIFLPARSTPGDYAELIAKPETGALIFDQRLGEMSGVSYEGIEAAEYLRAIRPELPIFILTQHKSDDLLLAKEEFVEYVIDKEDLTDLQHKAEVHAVRILRSMGRYNEILTEKQGRLKELLDRKLSDKLNEDELTELTKLRADLERPLESRASIIEAQQEAEQSSNKEFLNELKEITEQLRQLSNK